MNMSARILVSVFFIAAALFLAAGEGTAQSKIDSCSLVTKEDIKAVVGQSVGDGKPNPRANPVVGQPCNYKVGTNGSVSVLGKIASPAQTPDNVMTELKKMKMAVSDAPGIGDRSFFSSPGYGMVQLNTFKGSKYLIITMLVPGMPEGSQKAAAEKLMRKALAK